MRVRERDVSEVDAVHRLSVGPHCDIDVESGIHETQRRVVVDSDPVPLGMIREVDEDHQGWPGGLTINFRFECCNPVDNHHHTAGQKSMDNSPTAATSTSLRAAAVPAVRSSTTTGNRAPRPCRSTSPTTTPTLVAPPTSASSGHLAPTAHNSLMTAVAATKADQTLTLTEAVTSDSAVSSAPADASSIDIAGSEFITQEPFVNGGDDVHQLADHNGPNVITFTGPASNIWVAMWIDSHTKRIAKETIVDPGHRIEHTLTYPT